jgi:alkylhydroperoxidase family enzyme
MLLSVPASAIQHLEWNLDTVPERIQPVLRLARKLTQHPSAVTTADTSAVLAAGWDETALYHTIAVTALFNFMNRLVEGAGIELDPAYVKPASERLAKRGYLPLIAMFTK